MGSANVDQTSVVPDATGDTAAGRARIAGTTAPGGTLGRFVVLGAIGAGGMGVVLAAFDPELDRKVAIKVLHSVPAGDQARARLQREAQAMARLAHPNAVTVFEVGRAGEHLFIAMELVDGCNLREWLAAAARPWRDVLAMFVGAGRGLQAAHEADLVHRDFKPENVLIGQDGRPRVSDFGLAASGDYEGGVMGTPRYMAPEQWAGTGELDARSDQFAFCVALSTALGGQPPFEGDTSDELRANVQAGRRRPATPTRDDVPRWLSAIIDRGLAVDPAARWPSMAALLDEIARRTATRRRAWTLAGASALVAVTAGVVVMTSGARAAAAPVCAVPSARLATVWSPARKQALAARLVAVDATTGADRATAAATVFDHVTPGWSEMYVEACRANRVEGRQSDTALDARMQCLDRWLSSVDAAATRLEAATSAAEVEAAIKRVGSIAPIDACADVDTLLAAERLPEEATARAEAKAILAEVTAIEGERLANRVAGLTERADALVVRARSLGHPLVLSRALAVHWRIAIITGDIAGGLVILRETTEAVSRGGDDVEAAKTWALMGRLTAQFQGQPDEARVMMLAARAAVARAGDPLLVRAEVLTNEADVLTAAGDVAGAIADLAEARGLLERAGATQVGSPVAPALAALLQSVGQAHWYAGRLDEALPPLREAIVLFDRAYGRDTLDAAGVYIDLAQVLRDRGEFGDAETAIDQALRVRSRRDPTSADIAVALSVQAAIRSGRGRHDEAVALARRAYELASVTAAGGDAGLLAIQATIAEVLVTAGRDAEAIVVYAEVLAAATAASSVTANVTSWWLDRADAERRLARCPAAVASYQQGAAVAAQLGDEGERRVERARAGLTACGVRDRP